MDILNLTERITKEADLGLPFSIYRGRDHKPLDPEKPHVFITLADIPNDFLPADTESYSWIDFAHEPDKNLLHSPWINLLPEHRGGEIARKLNYIMEEVTRQMGFTHIRAYNIINEKLKRLMPRFGYTISGTDSQGDYLEKKL